MSTTPQKTKQNIKLKTKLSLAVVTLNEADNIERCLNSVPFADDVVVVDSGSTDATQALAEKNGARVFQVPWRGYRDQKRHATELCKNSWVLSLDADEALSSEAAEQIQALFAAGEPQEADAISFPRLSWNLGRWIRHGGWYPDRQTRLYHRARASWQGGEQVHERIEATRVLKLNGAILHWPFTSHAEQVETNNRYSTLGAVQLQQKGVRFSVAKLLFKPVSKFLETYVAKSGYRDGLAGLVISVGAAYSVFLKFTKLWELESRAEAQSAKTSDRP